MSIYKIQRKHGRPKCTWCGEPAKLRGYGWGAVSCAAHENELIAWDRKAQAPDRSDAQFYGKY